METGYELFPKIVAQLVKRSVQATARKLRWHFVFFINLFLWWLPTLFRFSASPILVGNRLEITFSKMKRKIEEKLRQPVPHLIFPNN